MNNSILLLGSKITYNVCRFKSKSDKCYSYGLELNFEHKSFIDYKQNLVTCLGGSLDSFTKQFYKFARGEKFDIVRDMNNYSEFDSCPEYQELIELELVNDRIYSLFKHCCVDMFRRFLLYHNMDNKRDVCINLGRPMKQYHASLEHINFKYITLNEHISGNENQICFNNIIDFLGHMFGRILERDILSHFMGTHPDLLNELVTSRDRQQKIAFDTLGTCKDILYHKFNNYNDHGVVTDINFINENHILKYKLLLTFQDGHIEYIIFDNILGSFKHNNLGAVDINILNNYRMILINIEIFNNKLFDGYGDQFNTSLNLLKDSGIFPIDQHNIMYSYIILALILLEIDTEFEHKIDNVEALSDITIPKHIITSFKNDTKLLYALRLFFNGVYSHTFSGDDFIPVTLSKNIHPQVRLYKHSFDKRIKISDVGKFNLRINTTNHINIFSNLDETLKVNFLASEYDLIINKQMLIEYIDRL